MTETEKTQVGVPMTKEQRTTIKEAADHAGLSEAAYIRSEMLKLSRERLKGAKDA